MILVTGFEPFLGQTVNPSGEIVKLLRADSAWSSRIKTEILPVSFARAPKILVEKATPDVRAVLMLGQAGGRAVISLERVALNWTESVRPDEDGFIPGTGPLRPGEASALICGWPLAQWANELNAEGCPTAVSFTAGSYVCNALAFEAARALSAIPSLFVHVPYIPEQVGLAKSILDASLTANTPPAPREIPSMPLTGQVRAIESILERIEREIGTPNS